jgi:hypothetical protein
MDLGGVTVTSGGAAAVRGRGHRMFRRGLLATACLLLVAVHGARADWATISGLAGSVRDRVFVNNDRLWSVAKQVTIRAKRGMALSGSGEAMYSDAWDLVLVPGKFMKDGKLKDLPTLLAEAGAANRDPAYDTVWTIWHEMGHAEWDHYIEESDGDSRDRAFYKLVTDEIVPWIDLREATVDDEWLAVMEWHGYYVGGVVKRLLTDADEFLFRNGIQSVTLEPDENQIQQNIRDGTVEPSVFGKLTAAPSIHFRKKDFKDVLVSSYGQRTRGLEIKVNNGWIDGLADVSTLKWTRENGFKDEWWDAIWQLVASRYLGPKNAQELLHRMNTAPIYAPALVKLRAAQERAWANRKKTTGARSPGVPGVRDERAPEAPQVLGVTDR